MTDNLDAKAAVEDIKLSAVKGATEVVETFKKEVSEGFASKTDMETLSTKTAELTQELNATREALANIKTAKKDDGISDEVHNFHKWLKGSSAKLSTDEGKEAFNKIRLAQQNISVPEQGGNLVPTELDRAIVKCTLEKSDVIGLFRTLPMGHTKEVAVRTDVPLAFLADESACVPVTGDKYNKAKLTAHRRSVHSTLSFDFMNFTEVDGLIPLLAEDAGLAFARKFDYEIFRGDPAQGEFQGFLTATAGTALSNITEKETAAAAKFTNEDLLDAIGAMPYGTADYIFLHCQTMIDLRKQANVANQGFYWSNDLTQAQTLRFNGIPVVPVYDTMVVDEALKQAGTAWDPNTMIKSISILDKPTATGTYTTGSFPAVIATRDSMAIGNAFGTFLSDDNGNVDVCGLTRNMAWHNYYDNALLCSNGAVRVKVK